MTPTEERLKALFHQHLDVGREPNFDTTFSESGFSSLDAINFFKVVMREFSIEIPAADCLKVQTLRQLASYIDSHTS